MTNEVKIDIIANSEKFQIAIEKAVTKIQQFGNKNRELASVLDSEYRNITRAANNLSGEIGKAFNSFNIKSDLGLGVLKKQIESDKLFFREQFKAIVEDANTSFGDVQRARRALAGIESTFDAQSLKNEFKTLGIESTASVEAMKVKVQNAFAEIVQSGTKYPQDIVRAHEAMTAEIQRLDKMLVSSAERAAAERVAAMREAQAGYAAQAMSEPGAASTLINQKLAGSEFSQRLQAEMEATSKINMAHEEALQMDIARNKKRLIDEEATLRKITLMHREAAKINSDFDKGLVDGEGIYKSLEKASLGFNLFSMAAIAKIQIMYSLINSVMSLLASLPSTIMTAVEDYESSVIGNAAMITSMQNGVENIGKAYQENKVYAEAVENVLIKMDTQTSASVKNLRDMNTQFVQQGILIDANNLKQYEGFKNLANALAVMNANAPNKEQQYSQEIRSLQDFSERPGNKLVQYLKSQGVTKEMIEDWKAFGRETQNNGYLLEKLDGYFKGFAEASKDIDGLWSTIKSTLQTTYTEILRGGMGDAVKEITEYVKDISKYTSEHKEEIQSGIYKAWLSVKGVLASVGMLLEAMNPVLTESDSLVGMIFKGWSLIFAVALPSVVEGVKNIIKALNAMVNIIYQSYAIMFNMAGAVGENLALAAKAAGQYMIGDFKGAGETAGKLFSGSFSNKIRDNIAGIKGAVSVIKEEFNKESSWSSRYNEWNKSFKETKSKTTVKQPSGILGASDEKELEKARKLEEEIDKKYLAYSKAFDEREIENKRNTLKTELEDLKIFHEKGLISTKEYYAGRLKSIEEANKYELELVQQQIDENQEIANKYASSDKREDYEKELEVLTKIEGFKKQYRKLELDGIKQIKSAKEESLKAAQAAYQEAVSEEIKVLELAGATVTAEEIKQAAYKETAKYKQLVIDSKTDINSQIIKDSIDIQNASTKLKKQQELNKSIREYGESINTANDAIDKLYGKNERYNSLTSEYRAGINKEADYQEQLNQLKQDELTKVGKLNEAEQQKLNLQKESLQTQLKLQQLQTEKNIKAIEEYSRGQFLIGQAIGTSGSYVTGPSGETKWVEKLIFAADYMKEQFKYTSDEELKATAKAESANDKLSAAGDKLNSSGDNLTLSGNNLNSSANSLTTAAGQFSSFMSNFKMGQVTSTNIGDSAVQVTISGLEEKATGGNVNPFTPYIMGEKGPELFMSNQGGAIIPNDVLRSSQSSSSGSVTHIAGGVNVVLPNVTRADDYEAIANGILAKLKVKNGRFL